MIAGLNPKYFKQSGPLEKLLTPQARTFINPYKAPAPTKVVQTVPSTVKVEKTTLGSAIKDMAVMGAKGVRGFARFGQSTYQNRADVLKEIETGLSLGRKQTTNAVLGFLSRPKVESNFTSIQNNKPLYDFETKIAPKMRDIIEKNKKIIGETPRTFSSQGSFSDKVKDPRYVFGAGAQQVPNLLATISGGLVAGIPGAIGVGFTLESQSAYEDAKAKGVSEDKARLNGAAVGIINSVLETLPILKFLNNTPVGKQAKRSILQTTKDLLLSASKQSIEEGGTEYLQEITANAIAKTYDENRGLFDNAMESGFFGAIIGGGTGAIGNVSNRNLGLTTEDVSDPLTTEARKGDYLYHGTNDMMLDSISKDGLKPMSRGVLSLSKDEAYAKSFARDGMTPQGKTNATMFRVKADAVKTIPSKSGVASDKLNELLTKETIPPEAIEVFRNGKWQPLKENPLITEARKYKSAEEFVKAFRQEKIDPEFAKKVYFGSAKDFTGKIGSDGLPTTVDPSVAKMFAKYHGGDSGVVQYRYISPDAKIIKFEDLPNSFRQEAKGIDAIEQASAWAKRNGYDGIDMRGSGNNINPEAEIRVFNEKAIIHPKDLQSQLTDIWNKAQPKSRAKPVSLQEKISNATTNLQKLGFERDSLDTKFDSADLESQYQAFKKLVSLQKLDTIQDDTALKTKVKASPEQIDNILYSQELNASEVFDMFKERRFQELSQRGEKGRINREEKVVKKELTKLEKVEKIRKEKESFAQRIRDAYDKRVAKIKSAKDILDNRRQFIKAVQKQFGLSDNDLRAITKRDIRLMDNLEFKTHLDNIRIKAEQLAERRQAFNVLNKQIKEKDLNVEPLRMALKLPPIGQMTTTQLIDFDKTLEPYQKGDVFLSKRKLETIEQTDLAGIKTYREAREIFNKKYGTDLNAISATEFDRLTGNAGLSEGNPFYKVMIQEFYQKLLTRESEYLDIEKRINEVASKFKTGILGKIIPQQSNIVKWFEAVDKSTVELTADEQEAVRIMQSEWIKARDYLIEQEALKKGISSDNYYTHVRRTFLEALKEDGLITAVKEIFQQQEQDQQVFEILDQDTGQVLPLQKFFQFALSRSGKLKPSANVVGAFLTYMKTFKKKQAIDESFPLIMTYADAFTPSETTQQGVLLNGSLKKFAKEWLNNQKGRRITLVMKQGGKGEFLLNTIKRGIMLLDLGFNLTVNAATQIGEQAVQFQLLGNKAYVIAKARAVTPKGRRITEKYRSLIGKNPWKQLIEPARKIGDRANLALFAIFQDANVRRTRNALLGMMTKEEFEAETLTPERLAEIRLAISRYGMIEGAGSVIGATPEAKVFTMYKNWALPIIGSTYRNARYLSNYIKSKGELNQVEAKRALVEIGRMVEIASFVTIIASMVGMDDDDDSLLGKLKKRAYQESTTILQALSPTTLFTTPRLLTFLDDLSKNLVSIMKLEAYESTKFGEYKAGDLKGIRALKRQLTPRAIRQFEGEKEKTEQDIAEEILDDIKSGRLDEKAAEEKLDSELKKLESKKKEERFKLPPKEYAQDLLDRLKSGETTEEQAEKELTQYEKRNAETFDSPDESTFIDKVKTYARAVGTDPVTAFTFIFQGEKIRRTDNGAIVVYRGKSSNPKEQLQFAVDKRKELGANEELILDHTLPLQLGGGNGNDNLKLVLKSDWESYTPAENYLGDKLRAGMISKDEAQKLIRDFKEGKITLEELMNK